ILAGINQQDTPLLLSLRTPEITITLDDVLRSLPADKPFKSSVMKRLFKGGSANNAGFLSAILRSDGLKLVQKADGNPMLHELVPDYLERLGSLTNELCTVTSTIE
ncbi:hypothetical protein UXH10_21080, partial [Aeromonas caviae]|nr:hypothetical protein [Aeromonas caviae]